MWCVYTLKNVGYTQKQMFLLNYSWQAYTNIFAFNSFRNERRFIFSIFVCHYSFLFTQAIITEKNLSCMYLENKILPFHYPFELYKSPWKRDITIRLFSLESNDFRKKITVAKSFRFWLSLNGLKMDFKQLLAVDTFNCYKVTPQ